jgi:hypothetical protein
MWTGLGDSKYGQVAGDLKIEAWDFLKEKNFMLSQYTYKGRLRNNDLIIEEKGQECQD